MSLQTPELSAIICVSHFSRQRSSVVQIFRWNVSPCSSLKSPRYCGNPPKCECRKWIFMLMLHPISGKFDSMLIWSSDLLLPRKLPKIWVPNSGFDISYWFWHNSFHDLAHLWPIKNTSFQFFSISNLGNLCEIISYRTGLIICDQWWCLSRLPPETHKKG